MEKSTSLLDRTQPILDLADGNAFHRLIETIDKLPDSDRAIIYRETLINFVERTLINGDRI